MVPFRASTTRWHSFQTFTRQSLQYRHSARFFYTRFCLDGNYKSLFQLLSFHPFSIFFPSTCTSYQDSTLQQNKASLTTILITIPKYGTQASNNTSTCPTSLLSSSSSRLLGSPSPSPSRPKLLLARCLKTRVEHPSS